LALDQAKEDLVALDQDKEDKEDLVAPVQDKEDLEAQALDKEVSAVPIQQTLAMELQEVVLVEIIP